jgi:hypothetical protein
LGFGKNRGRRCRIAGPFLFDSELLRERGRDDLDRVAELLERKPHELQQRAGDEHDDVHARNYRRLRAWLQPDGCLPIWGIGDRLKVGENLTRFD